MCTIFIKIDTVQHIHDRYIHVIYGETYAIHACRPVCPTRLPLLPAHAPTRRPYISICITLAISRPLPVCLSHCRRRYLLTYNYIGDTRQTRGDDALLSSITGCCYRH